MGWKIGAGRKPAEASQPDSNAAAQADDQANTAPQAVAAVAPENKNRSLDPIEEPIIPSLGISPAENHNFSSPGTNGAPSPAAALAAAVPAAPELDIPIDADVEDRLDLTQNPQGDLEDVVPAVARPAPSIHRRSATYTAPVAKTVQKLKRTELKRQLKNRVNVPATKHTVKDRSTQPGPPSSRARTTMSRGSRLLTMAHDAVPLQTMSLALPKPSKTPLALFGVEKTLQSGIEQASVPPLQGTESEAVQLQEQGDAIGAGPTPAEVAAEGTDNEIPVVNTQDVQNAGPTTEKNAFSAGVQLKNAPSSSPISFGQWCALENTAAAEGVVEEEGEVELERLPHPETAAAPVALPVACEPAVEEATATDGEEAPLSMEMESTPEPEPGFAMEDDTEEEQEEEEAEEAVFIGNGQNGNSFTPLPRLLPLWGATNSNGGCDSAVTSPSSCSLLPPGLSGGHSPRMKTKGSSARHEEENDSHPVGDRAGLGEEGGRRVRFVGIGEEELLEKDEADNELGVEKDGLCTQGEELAGDVTISRSSFPASYRAPVPIPPPSRSASVRPQITAPQSRFGIGAFVRMPASQAPPQAALSTTTAAGHPGHLHQSHYASNNTQAFDSEGFDGRDKILGGKKENSSTLNKEVSSTEDGTTENPTPPLVITRRLQHSGTLLRRNVVIPLTVPPPLAGDSVPQVLREAFLNARLAENWHQGESWARLDLCGIEIDQESGRGGHLNSVITTVSGQRGEAAVRAALEQLEAEWEHLRCLRQRYVSSPADDSAAPKSILKRASGVSHLPVGGAAAMGVDAVGAGGPADRTPPFHRRGATLDTTFLPPGSNEGLRNEMMTHLDIDPSPQEWGPLNEGSTRQGHVPQPQGRYGGGPRRGRLSAPLEVTPNMAIRSRGIKMLASLQQNSTPVVAITTTAAAGGGGGAPFLGGGIAGPTVSGQADGPKPQGTHNPVITNQRHQQPQPLMGMSLQQQQQHMTQPSNRPPSRSDGLRRGGSRGQRLLQALQNAAGPGTTPPTAAAAAAARLIVEPGSGELPASGAVATSFVVT